MLIMAILSRSRYLKTNAIVYFEEPLDERHRQTIESMVGRVEGVTDAHFNQTLQQLMIVDYDPKRTSSGAILSAVKRQHRQAELI